MRVENAVERFDAATFFLRARNVEITRARILERKAHELTASLDARPVIELAGSLRVRLRLRHDAEASSLRNVERMAKSLCGALVRVDLHPAKLDRKSTRL